MPENANEHALTTSQDSQAETTAGTPSPAALPAVESDILTRLKVTQCCDVVIDGMLGAAIEEIERLRAELRESLFSWESMRNLAAAHVVVLAKYGPAAPDSTRKRDGVAGDVQPLRPRE